MGTDQNNNFYFQGWWYFDTIRFGKFKALANSFDGFIGKTFDYAITRGYVFGGPYCAGDTILIPSGEKHATRNTGSEPLVLLCFFPVADIAQRTQEHKA